MLRFFITFFSSFIVTMLIIRFKHLHESYSSDWDLSGPQKIHTKIVPRVGGISIAIGLLLSAFWAPEHPIHSQLLLYMLICVAPIFVAGITEDITKRVDIRIRLGAGVLTSALAIYLLKIQITNLGLGTLDPINIIPLGSIFFTIFAICGLINAYNIIDGFNGLSSMTAVITLIAIALVGHAVKDPEITYLALTMVASILGFFFWNYPRGSIFLGDGGAYLIGFWIAVLSIMICYRHNEISPWFAILINCYPVAETLLTIYRRKFEDGKPASKADNKHLHTIIFRLIRPEGIAFINHYHSNAKVAPYIWIITIIPNTLALLLYKNNILMAGSTLLFFAFYIYAYKRTLKALKNG